MANSTAAKKSPIVAPTRLKILAPFTTDAAADAATASGVATDGSYYYNTVAGKMKVKESGSWKTVTTS